MGKKIIDTHILATRFPNWLPPDSSLVFATTIENSIITMRRNTIVQRMMEKALISSFEWGPGNAVFSELVHVAPPVVQTLHSRLALRAASASPQLPCQQEDNSSAFRSLATK